MNDMNTKMLAPRGSAAWPGNDRVHELGSDGAPTLDNAGLPLRRVGIVGAGSLGIDIATQLLDAGLAVTLYDEDRDALDTALAASRSAGGALAPQQRDRRMALLAATVYLHHLKDSDLIVEAAPADKAGTQQLFRRLDQVARPGAILLTLSPDCPVEEIASATRRLREVLGWRPAQTPGAQAWDLVPGKDTSADTLASVSALARTLGATAAR